MEIQQDGWVERVLGQVTWGARWHTSAQITVRDEGRSHELEHDVAHDNDCAEEEPRSLGCILETQW